MNIPIPGNLREGTPTYGAWKKGYTAGKEGKAKEDCPYKCTSFHGKRFQTCWLDGWECSRLAKKNI